MADDLERFIVKMSKVESLLQPTLVAGIRSAALTTVAVIRSETAAAAPGMRLRGVGRRGAKIGVGFDVVGTANPTALIRARGPYHLLERATKPHPVAARR